MTRHLENSAVICLSLLTALTVSCRTVNGTLPRSSAWPATPLKRVDTAAQIAAELPALNIPAPDGRIIFIGVHGGNPPTWDDAAWFDPQQWLPYQTIDLQDQDALSQIAYRESVMHVTALHIGQQFPNSITIMVRGDSQVVNELLEAVYRRGDRILLAGHSFGGRVVIKPENPSGTELVNIAVPEPRGPYGAYVRSTAISTAIHVCGRASSIM
jgi:hypothetical protein